MTGPSTEARRELMARVAAELDRAYGKHGVDPWGRHEYYAILLEEVQELWDAIKQDKSQAEVLDELVQVAAMCFRYYETGDRYRGPHPVSLGFGLALEDDPPPDARIALGRPGAYRRLAALEAAGMMAAAEWSDPGRVPAGWSAWDDLRKHWPALAKALDLVTDALKGPGWVPARVPPPRATEARTITSLGPG